MEKQKKVAVYIDGNNFYHKLKDLKLDNLTSFNYHRFSEWLAGTRKIIFSCYYIGVVRAKEGDEKGQQMRKDQQRLFSRLQSTEQNFIIKKGHLMQNDGIYHEKGVDVQIAIDMLIGAYKNFYDSAILISSDTDLIPAIKQVRNLKKEVEYVGFSHKPSLGLIGVVNSPKLLAKEDLEQFLDKTLI